MERLSKSLIRDYVRGVCQCVFVFVQREDRATPRAFGKTEERGRKKSDSESCGGGQLISLRVSRTPATTELKAILFSVFYFLV